MIEYLEQLIQQRRYAEAVSLGEQILLSKENSPKDVMTVNWALLTARVHLNDFSGALFAGEVALKQARELSMWDFFGSVCVDLGVVYNMLKQYENALRVWSDYIEYLPQYVAARSHEARVWFNLGSAYHTLGQYAKGTDAYVRALEVANRVGNLGFAYGIRQALVYIHLQNGTLLPIPELLVKCDQYLRRHPDEWNNLWQTSFRVQYAMATNRFSRAQRLALRGLERAGGKPRMQYVFHMLLAKLATKEHSPAHALRHALAARVYAVKCNRVDLEAQAAELAYSLVDKTSDSPLSFSSVG